MDAERLLPLNHVHFLILMALIDEEAHGYRIVKQIEAQSPEHLRVQPANLYRSLRTLRGQGLIRETDRRPDPAIDDSRRRYFAITELGREVARLEAARVQGLADAARRRALIPGAGD